MDIAPPEVALELLSGTKRITEKDIASAQSILAEYKRGKANLEKRIIEDELWWELRHWEAIRGRQSAEHPDPTSAWLFNAILGKHADAMDNYPEPAVLPRERSDEESAKILSSVLPVVLEYNDFEDTYDYNWWELLKHGTAPYGIFWDSNKENGLGDISITPIDLLSLFWEPGITDLQDSANLFITQLVDTERLNAMYPEHKGRLGGNAVDMAQYIYDDTVDTSDKSVVVDWYYKVRTASGRTVLHYVKFVGDTLLFASENEAQYRESGWYEHGLYPVVLDTLFPEKGTPIGFGYVAICKDPQMYIDKLYGNILETAMMASRPRFFLGSNTNMNEEEFKDWTRPIIHLEGELDDRKLQQFKMDPPASILVDIAQLKIEEMKDTASNRDVNSGGVGSGVTAASAIAALQEAGNKVSRDMIKGSYRAFSSICAMALELMRQFYTETRAFRITAANGEYQFIDMNNSGLQEQPIGMVGGQMMYRRPVFDIKIKAQKTSPFSRMEQNERAKELYSLGFFNPDRAQEALGALEMMDFEGIDKVKEQVQQGQTLINILNQMSQQLAMLTGAMPAAGGAGAPAEQAASSGGGGSTIDAEAKQAQTPQPGYTEKILQKTRMDMNNPSSAATPQ